MSNNPKFTFSNDHFFHCGTRGGWELLVGLLWDPWWVGTLGWTFVGPVVGGNSWLDLGGYNYPVMYLYWYQCACTYEVAVLWHFLRSILIVVS